MVRTARGDQQLIGHRKRTCVSSSSCLSLVMASSAWPMRRLASASTQCVPTSCATCMGVGVGVGARAWVRVECAAGAWSARWCTARYTRCSHSRGNACVCAAVSQEGALSLISSARRQALVPMGEGQCDGRPCGGPDHHLMGTKRASLP